MKKSNKNIYIIVGIIIATIVVGVVLLAIFLSPKKEKDVLLLDTVTKAESDKIIKNEMKVTFGEVEGLDTEKRTYVLNLVVENKTDVDKAFCFEVSGLNDKGTSVTFGEVFIEYIPKGESKEAKITMNCLEDNCKDIDKLTYEVDRAYSAQVYDDDHKMNKVETK